MNIQIHSIHFNADRKLLEFVSSKVRKLGQYHDRIIAGEVYLRLDKSADTENKIAEIKMKIPGRELFARKKCKTFEEATDNSVEAIQRQLKKYKEKKRGNAGGDSLW